MSGAPGPDLDASSTQRGKVTKTLSRPLPTGRYRFTSKSPWKCESSARHVRGAPPRARSQRDCLCTRAARDGRRANVVYVEKREWRVDSPTDKISRRTSWRFCGRAVGADTKRAQLARSGALPCRRVHPAAKLLLRRAALGGSGTFVPKNGSAISNSITAPGRCAQHALSTGPSSSARLRPTQFAISGA